MAHHLLAYDDDVNVLGGSIHKLKEKGEVLVYQGDWTGSKC